MGGLIAFLLVALTLVGVGVYFLVNFLNKTGPFRVPGVVIYDSSLTAAEVAEVKEIFGEMVDLDKNVTVSAAEYLTRPELREGEFLTEIFVPVTDFYSVETNVSAMEAGELFSCENCSYKMIPVGELDFKQKLLRINDKYYLDGFKSGAVFRVLKFESERYTEEIASLVGDKFTRIFPEDSSVLTLAQTGVTAFSRLMNAKMNQVGDGTYFAANIGEFLSGFDLTHTSSEASFVENPSTSGGTGVPICSDYRFRDTLSAIGLDIVELTGNHNLDCGIQAANEAIDIYTEMGIKIVGGGRNATEAAVPLEIDEKKNSVTMLAFNESTGGATLGDYPGANQYYEETARAQIAEAKARGDLVIVDVQYYECSIYVDEGEDGTCDAADSSAGDQIGMFRSLIDMGADVVVGTSAHQPQTFELYGGGVIYYGLGNLFFDQYLWPGTTRSLVLVHHIYQDKLLQTEILPTEYDGNFQTSLMGKDKARWYLERLAAARP